MKKCVVLVDFENVQPQNVGLLNKATFKIIVFVGAYQAKIPVDIARALQAFGAAAEYIQIEGSGPNALDFHIAYYIGRMAAEAPDACFYVVSKDSGFDPLIKHVTKQNIVCKRFRSIADIEPSRTTDSGSASEKVEAIRKNLARRKTARPRSIKTLRSTIKALYRNQLMHEELDELIEQLTQSGAITVIDGKVHYQEQSGRRA